MSKSEYDAVKEQGDTAHATDNTVRTIEAVHRVHHAGDPDRAHEDVEPVGQQLGPKSGHAQEGGQGDVYAEAEARWNIVSVVRGTESDRHATCQNQRQHLPHDRVLCGLIRDNRGVYGESAEQGGNLRVNLARRWNVHDMQTVRQPRHVLAALLRIADHAIVSFPNFGHWRVRLSLLTQGRMPTTGALPTAWWETENIHLCTLRDFTQLCADLDLHIEACAALAAGKPARSIDPLLLLVGLMELLTGCPGGGSSVSLAAQPRSSTVSVRNSVMFTATVTGTMNTGVNWLVMEGAAGGTGLTAWHLTGP